MYCFAKTEINDSSLSLFWYEKMIDLLSMSKSRFMRSSIHVLNSCQNLVTFSHSVNRCDIVSA